MKLYDGTVLLVEDDAIDYLENEKGWLAGGTLYVDPERRFALAAATPRLLTRLQFRNRFTAAEKGSIYAAADTTPEIRAWLDDLMAAESVDLDDAHTVAGVQALETAALIGAGRAAEILA